MVLAAQEDYLAAREYFERAVANDAEFTVAYIGLAQALTEIKEFEAARDALGRAEALATHADDVANAINDLEQRISESP
jgi:tetratricopeptide (TPR) repeat protein